MATPIFLITLAKNGLIVRMNHSNVAEETQTCFVCPTQWEGRMDTGEYFYFRFRHGTASLGFGGTPGEANHNSSSNSLYISQDADGFLDYSEYVQVFDRLVYYRGRDW